MRRFLLIGLAVLAIAALAALAYFLFFRPTAPGVIVGPVGNPFGEGEDIAVPAGTDTEQFPVGTPGEAGVEVAPNLIRITDGPVAYGALARALPVEVTVPLGEGTSTAPSTRIIYRAEIRYIERESGNVYAYDFEDRTLTRLSNRTLPGVEEASWAGDGSFALARFLSDEDGERVETYLLPAEGEGGYFLEVGLADAFVTGSSTLTTLLVGTDGSIATAANEDGSGTRTIFSSPLSSLRLLPAGSSYGAYTKASAQSDGFGFLISATGTFERVLGPLRGLTLLPSPSGKSLVYSALSGNTIRTEMMSTATRTMTPLPLGALPEKCVWTVDEAAIYCAVPRALGVGWPDAWYQGTTSFSDRLWKIDLVARTAILVVDPVQVAETAIDAVALAIDPKNDVLVFINRNDGSLWAYDL